MSDNVFGEIDWNDGDAGNGGNTTFMKLEQGANVVRVMANPIQFYTHWLELPDGSKTKVNSPIESPELVQKLEDAGFKRKPRWLLKVLDVEEREFKLLEIGPQVYNGIRALYNNPKWGKVTAYDITVHRGKPGTQPLYTVTPDPKEPLDGSLKSKFMDFNDNLNIEKLIQPARPADICAKLNWSMPSDVSGTSNDDEEDDFEFDFEDQD